MRKSGFVSIIGKPNAGKSTLFNALLGEELSAVTYKPQTTRNKITGILTIDNNQIIFLDTPGHLKPSYKLQEFMEKEIDESLADTDLVLMIIDSEKFNLESVKQLYNSFEMALKGKKLFLVINKIDTIKKEKVLQIIDDVSKNIQFKEIIPVSAKKKFNVKELLDVILKNLPEHEFYFDSESLTDRSERFFISDIIRKQVLKLFSEEIPYSVFIEIIEFKTRENGVVYINSNIILDRESHKKIIIGNEGRMIKMIGERARKEIEEFLKTKIYLELHVKVFKDWKNNENFLRRNFK